MYPRDAKQYCPISFLERSFISVNGLREFFFKNLFISLTVSFLIELVTEIDPFDAFVVEYFAQKALDLFQEMVVNQVLLFSSFFLFLPFILSFM